MWRWKPIAHPHWVEWRYADGGGLARLRPDRWDAVSATGAALGGFPSAREAKLAVESAARHAGLHNRLRGHTETIPAYLRRG